MAANAGAGASGLAYKRLLLKLSGEALMGKGDFGIDMAVAERLARDIAEAISAGLRDLRRRRRRQHLPRPCRGGQGHGARHRRLHGHAGDGDERAGAAECAGERQSAGPRPLRHPDADRVRELRAPPRRCTT